MRRITIKEFYPGDFDSQETLYKKARKIKRFLSDNDISSWPSENLEGIIEIFEIEFDLNNKNPDEGGLISGILAGAELIHPNEAWGDPEAYRVGLSLYR